MAVLVSDLLRKYPPSRTVTHRHSHRHTLLVAYSLAPSTSDGHTFAFGNTLEKLRRDVLGLAARGEPGDRPLDRHTGLGRVDARDGDYADAQSKGSLGPLNP